MDDKTFREILKTYVSTKSRGKDVDFKKLYEKEQNVAIPRQKYHKVVWASLTVVLIIAVTLAIVLPVTLLDKNGGNIPEEETPSSPIYYYESQNIELMMVDNITDLLNQYDISVIIPGIVYQDMSAFVLKDKPSNSVIGARMEIGVYDEIFDAVTIHVLPMQNEIDYLTSYEAFTEEITWDKILVKQYIEYNDFDGSYRAKLFFVMHNHKYYIETTYYQNIETADLLALIFHSN